MFFRLSHIWHYVRSYYHNWDVLKMVYSAKRILTFRSQKEKKMTEQNFPQIVKPAGASFIRVVWSTQITRIKIIDSRGYLQLWSSTVPDLSYRLLKLKVLLVMKSFLLSTWSKIVKSIIPAQPSCIKKCTNIRKMSHMSPVSKQTAPLQFETIVNVVFIFHSVFLIPLASWKCSTFETQRNWFAIAFWPDFSTIFHSFFFPDSSCSLFHTQSGGKYSTR